MLTPVNNDQFSAKLAAAFTSGKVPDVMLIYSGGYTTPYMLSCSRSSTTGSPRLRDSTTRSDWDLSCVDLDCQGGNGEIYGVPIDFGSYGLFYNKALLQEGRVAAPPKTFDELLAACDKLQGEGRSSRSPTATATATRRTTG